MFALNNVDIYIYFETYFKSLFVQVQRVDSYIKQKKDNKVIHFQSTHLAVKEYNLNRWN